MIFISRFTNYRLGLRPTIKQMVHSQSGSEELLIHKGVTVTFQNAVFDTKNWRQYTHPESPDRINVIQSEADLIRLMKASPFYGTDFFERVVESKAEKAAKLRAELAKLEAEDLADSLDGGIGDQTPHADTQDAPGAMKKGGSRNKTKRDQMPPDLPKIKKTRIVSQKASRIEL